MSQFPSGHSNLTYLVEGGGKQLVLRRPPFGSQGQDARTTWGASTASCRSCTRSIRRRRSRWRTARTRRSSARRSTSWSASSASSCGAIRRPSLLPPETARAASARRSSTTWRELHALDYRAAGLGDLGKPDGYVERQVRGWAERYRNARTDDIPDMEFLERWLAEHMPKESGAALIHNDYKYDNLVLAPDDLTRIIGVLDWEMSTVGDPLMDLGTALGYWVEADDPPPLQAVRMCATTLPGSLTRASSWRDIRSAPARDIANILFYYCFALFKTCRRGAADLLPLQAGADPGRALRAR